MNKYFWIFENCFLITKTFFIQTFYILIIQTNCIQVIVSKGNFWWNKHVTCCVKGCLNQSRLNKNVSYHKIILSYLGYGQSQDQSYLKLAMYVLITLPEIHLMEAKNYKVMFPWWQFKYSQGSTNLIFACTDFCARKIVLHISLYMQNYMCIKQSLWVLVYIVKFTMC